MPFFQGSSDFEIKNSTFSEGDSPNYSLHGNHGVAFHSPNANNGVNASGFTPSHQSLTAGLSLPSPPVSSQDPAVASSPLANVGNIPQRGAYGHTLSPQSPPEPTRVQTAPALTPQNPPAPPASYPPFHSQSDALLREEEIILYAASIIGRRRAAQPGLPVPSSGGADQADARRVSVQPPAPTTIAPSHSPLGNTTGNPPAINKVKHKSWFGGIFRRTSKD